MEDGKEKETSTQTIESNDKPISIVDEARAIRDEIIKAKEELQTERMALEKLQSEKLLSGTSGGHVEAEPAKEETPKEYADKIMKNEVKQE